MMPLRDITEFDLLGVLFVLYPTNLPTEQCRERLEMEITLASLDESSYEYASPEDREVCISPFWIDRVRFRRAEEWVNRTSPSDRLIALDIIWRFRCEKMMRKGMRNVNWTLFRQDDPNDDLQPKQPKKKKIQPTSEK